MDYVLGYISTPKARSVIDGAGMGLLWRTVLIPGECRGETGVAQMCVESWVTKFF